MLRRALHLLRIVGMTIAAISSMDVATGSPALQLSLHRLESWICRELKEIRRCTQMTNPLSECRKRGCRCIALVPSFRYVASMLGSAENRRRYSGVRGRRVPYRESRKRVRRHVALLPSIRYVASMLASVGKSNETHRSATHETIAAILKTNASMRRPALQLSFRCVGTWIRQELKDVRR